VDNVGRVRVCEEPDGERVTQRKRERKGERKTESFDSVDLKVGACCGVVCVCRV